MCRIVSRLKVKRVLGAYAAEIYSVILTARAVAMNSPLARNICQRPDEVVPKQRFMVFRQTMNLSD